MTPPRVVPFAPHARAPNPRARVAGSTPRPIRVSPTRPRSRVTDARDGERRWNFHSTVRARHRAVSRVALCGRARARERASDQRLDSGPTRPGPAGSHWWRTTDPTADRPRNVGTAPLDRDATRVERTNERDASDDANRRSVRTASRGARGDDGRTREGGGEKREIFEGWMSC